MVGADVRERRADLQGLAESLRISDQIQWLGPQTDLGQLYRAFDWLVLSSRSGEGFPNVLAEAMACGGRCLTTDVGDGGTIVGTLGLTVPPRDVDALAEGMIAACDAPPRADAQELWSSIDSRYSLAPWRSE